MNLLDFLASNTGRWVRAAVGAVLLVLAFVLGGTWLWVLGILGVVFVAVGALDVCLLALAVGVALLVVPEAGGRLLRWVLGGYLTASGVASLGLAWAAHRGAARRLQEYLVRRP